MTALRLLSSAGARAAARPAVARQGARALATSAARAQKDGVPQSWNEAIQDVNKSFNAGVKDAASAMEHSLDDISANAKPYAEDIAARLKAVFGDGAPSAKDVQKELERQAKQARNLVEQSANELQSDANTRGKLEGRLADDFKNELSNLNKRASN